MMVTKEDQVEGMGGREGMSIERRGRGEVRKEMKGERSSE